MTLNVFQSEERQHRPSVFQVAEAAGHPRVIDFCSLSNKFLPTPEIMAKLETNLEVIVRNYPSVQTKQVERAAALTGFDLQR